MSQENFQDRLQRIDARSAQQLPPQQSPARRSARSLNMGKLVLGALTLLISSQAAKYLNENYETMRDSYGIGAVAGLGLVAMIGMIFATVWLFRGFSQQPNSTAKRQGSPHSSLAMRTTRQASGRAKTICSLVGLSLGFSAYILLLLSTAARDIETEQVIALAKGSAIAAVGLCGLSFLLGVLEILFRGYALWRIPLYYFVGGILSFVVFRAFGIDWLLTQKFVEHLQ